MAILHKYVKAFAIAKPGANHNETQLFSNGTKIWPYLFSIFLVRDNQNHSFLWLSRNCVDSTVITEALCQLKLLKQHLFCKRRTQQILITWWIIIQKFYKIYLGLKKKYKFFYSAQQHALVEQIYTVEGYILTYAVCSSCFSTR